MVSKRNLLFRGLRTSGFYVKFQGCKAMGFQLPVPQLVSWSPDFIGFPHLPWPLGVEVAQRRAVGGSSVGLVGWTLDVGQTNEGSNGTGRFTYILNLVDFYTIPWINMDAMWLIFIQSHGSIWLIFVVNVGKYTNPMDPMEIHGPWMKMNGTIKPHFCDFGVFFLFILL